MRILWFNRYLLQLLFVTSALAPKSPDTAPFIRIVWIQFFPDWLKINEISGKWQRRWPAVSAGWSVPMNSLRCKENEAFTGEKGKRGKPLRCDSWPVTRESENWELIYFCFVYLAFWLCFLLRCKVCVYVCVCECVCVCVYFVTTETIAVLWFFRD